MGLHRSSIIRLISTRRPSESFAAIEMLAINLRAIPTIRPYSNRRRSREHCYELAMSRGRREPEESDDAMIHLFKVKAPSKGSFCVMYKQPHVHI